MSGQCTGLENSPNKHGNKRFIESKLVSQLKSQKNTYPRCFRVYSDTFIKDENVKKNSF